MIGVTPLQRASNRGFTLIELLVALTIVGLTLTVMSGGLSVSARSADAVDSRVARNEELYLVQSYLRRQLEQMRIIDLAVTGNERAPALVATADRLEFVAPFAANAAPPGLHHIALSFERQGPYDGPLQLLLGYAAAGDERRDATTRKVLLSGLREARWQYLVADGRHKARWMNEFAPRGELPKLIRLQLQWQEPGRNADEFIFAPRISTNAGRGDRRGS